MIDTTLTGHLQVQEGVGIAIHQSHDLALERDSLALVVDLSDRVMREHGGRGRQDGDGDGLTGEGYEVVVARTGEEALSSVTTDTFDAILLDLTLPVRDGLEVLKTLREQQLLTPVIALTARDTVQDRVAGLDAGADDYLVKPFAFTEAEKVSQLHHISVSAGLRGVFPLRIMVL